MPIEELKQRLHSLIDASLNETLLEDLLTEAQTRSVSAKPYEAEGLTKEDYEELLSLVNEPAEQDTITNTALKASLSRWFTS